MRRLPIEVRGAAWQTATSPGDVVRQHLLGRCINWRCGMSADGQAQPRQFDDVMCRANELIVPVRRLARSWTNSRHWPDGALDDVKLDEISRPVTTKLSA